MLMCVRAGTRNILIWVRARACARVRARVRACACACVRARVCIRIYRCNLPPRAEVHRDAGAESESETDVKLSDLKQM